MKKWILAIVIFIAFCLLLIYIFIPAPVRISNSISLKSSLEGTLRSIRNDALWSTLSAGRIKAGEAIFNGTNMVADSLKGKPVDGRIMLVPMKPDSTILLWEFQMKKSSGPLARIKDYFRGVSIKENMDETIRKMKTFCEDTKQVYGIDIIPKSTTDTLLVATKFTVNHYPQNEEIYQKVNELKNYITTNKASVTGYPMLNITRFDSSYKCMVAVPVNRIMNDYNDIFFVRMIPGRFLTAEIKGGPATIKKAQDMMYLYFQDFRRTSMAVPYEYMVTDRIQEKDTSKWVTRLYSPVY